MNVSNDQRHETNNGNSDNFCLMSPGRYQCSGSADVPSYCSGEDDKSFKIEFQGSQAKISQAAANNREVSSRDPKSNGTRG